MQLSLSMLVGLVAGAGIFLVIGTHARTAMWAALVLAVIGGAAFLLTINGGFIPQLGRAGIVGVGLLSGIATSLAAGCVVKGERRPLNWVVLALAAAPVLFLLVFGVAELLGPPH